MYVKLFFKKKQEDYKSRRQYKIFLFLNKILALTASLRPKVSNA